MSKKMTIPNKLKPAVYLWATVLSALIGFSLIYVTLRLNSNDKVASISSGQAEAMKQKGNSAPAKPTAGITSVKPASVISALQGYNRGHMATFVIGAKPRQLPDIAFKTEAGETKTLADWRGKLVLLNLWATWCAPCRVEMPALDKLNAEFAGSKFDLVTISIDRGGLSKPRRFFDQINIKNLTLYGAQSRSLTAKLRALGMPTTLLIDGSGREIGRLVGPADWASEDARNLIKAAIGAAG